MPFSGYILNVFVKTIKGEHNPDLPLTLTAVTKSADKAGVPRNFKVTKFGDKFQNLASWLPPYPPTGQSKYKQTLI